MSLMNREEALLERLNDLESPRGFFLEVVTLIEEAVDSLIRRALRQEEYAVKYAINPLLTQSGPLGQIDVRLKLIYALGLISQKTYQEIEIYLKLREELVRDRHDHRFSSPLLRARLESLHSVATLLPPALSVDENDFDADLYALQLQRHDKIVRSALILALTSIIKELSKESPI